ncbi:MAG: LiaF domain-containing protein [bacterium]
MNSSRARILIAIGLATPWLAGAQTSPLWRSVDFSRQLRDTAPQRVRVQYNAGRVDVRGTDDPLLYSMHLRYDESRTAPLHSYDADQRSTILGLEARGDMQRTPSNAESGELRLTLPRAVPLDLDMAFGGTESRLDLGEMSLQSVRLKCGAADATLLFSRLNRVHMRELEVSVGAADFTAMHLANANTDQIRVQGGIGDVDLDFSGTWARDLTVVAQLAVGKLTLRLPPDVGVRLDVERVFTSFDHAGLVKRADSWYSVNYDQAPHKLHIRAQTVLGMIDVQQTTR